MLLRKLYYLQKVERQQWLKPAELQRLQDGKLRAIVRHAYANVPFYRRRWKAVGVRPDDIRTRDDMRRLPVVTKSDICKNYKDVIAANYRRVYRSGSLSLTHTSGTSGILMQTPFDLDSWDYLQAANARGLMAVGCRPTKTTAYYWYELPKAEFYHRWFFRKTYMLSRMTDDGHVRLLSKTRPEYIFYYSSALYSIAQKILREGVEIRPELVLSQAEVLSPRMAERISKAFDAPVYDVYAMNEFFRIAWQCREDGGYHVDSDCVLHEIVDSDLEEDAASGEVGNVLLTGLSNYVFPLIRYDTGDLAADMPDRCACGRGLPMIESIEGRRSRSMKLKSGKQLTERAAIDIVAGVKNVSKFSLQYLGRNAFKIKIVPLDERRAAVGLAENEIEKRFAERLCEPVKVKFDVSGDIAKERYGKMHMVTLPAGRNRSVG